MSANMQWAERRRKGKKYSVCWRPSLLVNDIEVTLHWLELGHTKLRGSEVRLSLLCVSQHEELNWTSVSKRVETS